MEVSMTDVNEGQVNDQVASSATEQSQGQVEGTPSAETSNTEKVPESVPYGRFKEVNEEKNSLKEQLESQAARAEALQRYQQQQLQAQHQYQGVGYTQQPQVDPLTDQFGTDGAQAIRGLVEDKERQIYQQQYAQQYAQEYQKGLAEHGDTWKKFDFVDQSTGALRNKILDIRSTSGLTSEEAWRALNPTDTKKIEQSVRDQTYQEIEKKAEATPSASNVQSGGSEPAEPTSVSQAFAMALKQHGVG
jgi:hypothetical protein